MLARLMGLQTISPKELHRLIEEGQVATFDLNSRQSWITARVPGAIHLDPVTWTDNDLPADKNAALVFYCSNPLCAKAPNAARRASSMGHSNVRVMSAGIRGWLAAQLPAQSGEQGISPMQPA